MPGKPEPQKFSRTKSAATSGLAGQAAPQRYLELAELAGLETMRFSTARRIEGSFSGKHVARRQGGAGQFIDSREYAAGDDLRRLDWPAMGRTGRAYIRLYQDETNLACLLTLDASGSMHFGAKNQSDPTGSKLEWAKYFSTALSHLIALGRDQVGLAVARRPRMGATNPFLAAGGSQRHLQNLYEQIADLESFGRTRVGQSLDDSFVRVRRRGVIMVVSDFLEEPFEDVLRGLRKFRGRGWETIGVHLVHPDEETLPKGVAYRFCGMEGEASVNCRPAEVRKLYQERFEEHCRRVREGLLAVGCDYRRFSTGMPYLHAVRQFLVPRRG